MQAESESRCHEDLGIAPVGHYLARQTHHGGDIGAIRVHSFAHCPLPTTVEAPMGMDINDLYSVENL